jgi:thioredoxin-related protein
MIKKLAIVLGVTTLVVLIQSFITTVQVPAKESSEPVHWYTIPEAVLLQKKKPKMILFDVSTSWCGPCKLMMINTFGNEKIAKYLNDNFYPVKLDAETHDSINFNGTVFRNGNPKGTQVHDFASFILDGDIMYPSIVFFDENFKRVKVVVGYYKADEFEPLIKFLGSRKYMDTKYEDFKKTFVSEIK